MPAEPALSRILYAMAWKNFIENPAVVVRRLVQGSAQFLHDLPGVLWGGYSGAPVPYWVPRFFLSLLVILGLARAMIRLGNRKEILFWALSWAAIIASASIVYLDDGARTMAVSYPLVWAFVAMGVAQPGAVGLEKPAFSRGLAGFGLIIFSIVGFMFLFTPWLIIACRPPRSCSGTHGRRQQRKNVSCLAAAARPACW